MQPTIERGSRSGCDRRKEACPAVDNGATVYFIDVGSRISGRIVDVSLGGCRIRIYRRVETEFKLDGMPFRLAGVVQALHDRHTVGIRFLDMSPRKRDPLAQLIEEMKSQEQQ